MSSPSKEATVHYYNSTYGSKFKRLSWRNPFSFMLEVHASALSEIHMHVLCTCYAHVMILCRIFIKYEVWEHKLIHSSKNILVSYVSYLLNCLKHNIKKTEIKSTSFSTKWPCFLLSRGQNIQYYKSIYHYLKKN